MSIAATPLLNGFATSRRWQGRRYLVSPLVDFLLVGGLALAIIPLLAWFVPRDVTSDVTLKPYSAFLAALVTYHVFAINYPHFAFSYQIAYRRVPRIRDMSLPPMVRFRYAFALFGFPLAYLGYCANALLFSDAYVGTVLLGFLINVMFFTVGWHYCKQCFGILMVLSALNKFYFTKRERRLLLANAMLVWIVSWLGGNIVAAQSQYWGLPWLSLAMGDWLPWGSEFLIPVHRTMMLAVQLLGALAVLMVFTKAYREKTWPSLTGVLGYAMMYPLVLIGYQLHPFWFWIVPALHSLQYLLFVAAYKQGELRAADAPAAGWRRHGLALFVAAGVAIGAAQFSWIPQLLNAIVSPADKLHIPLLFLALGHVFVNIHHYFIDNVIWRRENPEVARYLLHDA